MELRVGVIAAVILGGLFGSASATVVSIDAGVMVVDFEVEVVGAGGSVVAHLSFDEQSVATLPLLERGDGLYGIRTELEPKNYVVVFEVIGEESPSSDPVTLTQLGADFGSGAGGPATSEPDEDGLSRESSRFLWLAIALGAASLSALAFWVLGARDDGGDEEGEPTGSGPTDTGEEE